MFYDIDRETPIQVSGARAAVYNAVNLRTGEKVALKTRTKGYFARRRNRLAHHVHEAPEFATQPAHSGCG